MARPPVKSAEENTRIVMAVLREEITIAEGLGDEVGISRSQIWRVLDDLDPRTPTDPLVADVARPRLLGESHRRLRAARRPGHTGRSRRKGDGPHHRLHPQGQAVALDLRQYAPQSCLMSTRTSARRHCVVTGRPVQFRLRNVNHSRTVNCLLPTESA